MSLLGYISSNINPYLLYLLTGLSIFLASQHLIPLPTQFLMGYFLQPVAYAYFQFIFDLFFMRMFPAFCKE